MGSARGSSAGRESGGGGVGLVAVGFGTVKFRANANGRSISRFVEYSRPRFGADFRGQEACGRSAATQEESYGTGLR
jgi:hypothetical protein